MIFLLISIFIIIIALEIPQLIKKSYFKEIGVFIFFFIIGLYMSLAQLYGWKLYNPLEALIILMAPLV